MISEGGKKYQVIYADPPWSYKGAMYERGGAENHYNTESQQSLKNMPVGSLAAQNSSLFMWATFPLLQEALDLGAAWGFKYRTVAFVWVKKNKVANTPFVGMGFYTRANAGIVLHFTKGKALPRQSKNVESIIFSEIGKHSQKPDEVRQRIKRLFGSVPSIELFARSRKGFFPDYEYEGWDVYGNEVNNSISL